MADTPNRKSDALWAEQSELAPNLLDKFDEHPIDTAWVKECDTGMVITFESLVKNLVLGMISDELEGEDPDPWFQTEGDIHSYAQSIARSSTYMFNACRINDVDSLMVLLIRATELGYKSGVRDSHEGRLSREARANIAERRNRMDAERDALHAFHEELLEY
jgi:hypothetical protein